MREVVGLKTIDGILTTDRKSVETDVQQRMQNLLDSYRAGVLVKQVQLQSVDAPSQVISAYRDVTAAQQDQQRAVNEAETYANKVVPEAEGGASRISPRPRPTASRQSWTPRARPPATIRSTNNTRRRPASPASACILRRWSAFLARWTRRSSIPNSASPPVPYIALEPLQSRPAGGVK